MSDEQPKGRTSIGEGLRAGIGILAAFREAVEETLQEAMERNDLRPERAMDAVNVAVDRMQAALGDVRERVDVVPRREFDALREEVARLRARLEALEARHGGGAAAGGAHLPGDVGSPGVFEGGGIGGTVNEPGRGVVDGGGL